MPWRKVLPMEEKQFFISDFMSGKYSVTELSARYNISRKTAYKWIGRFERYGMNGLVERARRACRCPHRTPNKIREAVIELRVQHPRWGATKLLNVIGMGHPDWRMPSRVTVHKMLQHESLVLHRRRRRPVMPREPLYGPVERPNQTWTADYKGQFKLRDGRYCYPLTIMDSYSRYMLACVALHGTTYAEAREVFERVFTQYGIPDRLRTDNGVPFASNSFCGLTRLSVWWIRLGIRPERIRPGCPQENGRHERMHRTLAEDTIYPSAHTPKEQQQRFDTFCKIYNQERPHEALGNKTPAMLYRPSNRQMQTPLPPMVYPPNMERLYVNHNGCVSWKGRYLYVGYKLASETIGVEMVKNDLWQVYFGVMRLGYIVPGHMSLCANFNKKV